MRCKNTVDECQIPRANQYSKQKMVKPTFFFVRQQQNYAQRQVDGCTNAMQNAHRMRKKNCKFLI